MLKKRIFHLFNAFQVGGVERQHMLLLERLIDDFDHICWSYNHGPIEAELDMLGVPHCAGNVTVLKRMLDNTFYDCILVRTNRFLHETVPLLKNTKVPIVYFRNYLRWFEGNRTYFDKKLETLAISMADHCLFSGPMLRTPVLQAGIYPPGGELLYNGIDCSRLPLSPKRRNIAQAVRVGILGNIVRHKNQVDAVLALKESMLQGRIVMQLGGAEQDAGYAAELRAVAENLPVKFYGYVADPIAFMNEIDILLVSSTAEGWPNVIMEAFASGLPVVAPDIGDVREEFGPAPPGFLFERGRFEEIPDLIMAAAGEETYKKLSRLAVERARKFDIGQQASKLSKVICQTIARVSPRLRGGLKR